MDSSCYFEDLRYIKPHLEVRGGGGGGGRENRRLSGGIVKGGWGEGGYSGGLPPGRWMTHTCHLEGVVWSPLLAGVTSPGGSHQQDAILLSAALQRHNNYGREQGLPELVSHFVVDSLALSFLGNVSSIYRVMFVLRQQKCAASFNKMPFTDLKKCHNSDGDILYFSIILEFWNCSTNYSLGESKESMNICSFIILLRFLGGQEFSSIWNIAQSVPW